MAVSTDPNDPNFGLETDPENPDFGLAPKEQPPEPAQLTNVASMKSGVAQMSPEARAATDVTNQAVVQAIPQALEGAQTAGMAVMTGGGSLVSEALTPQPVKDFMRTPLVLPESVDTARQAAQYPIPTLSNILFGTDFKEQGPLAKVGRFASDQLAGQVTPENLAIIAGTEGLGTLQKGLVKKAPSLVETLFGKRNPVSELTAATEREVIPTPETVRLYHGSASGSQVGSDFTPLHDYASGYAAKGQGGKVYYVDVPKDAPYLIKDESINQLISKQTLPQEVVNQAKILGEPYASKIQEPAPTDGGLRARGELPQLPQGNVEAADARLRSDQGIQPAEARQGTEAKPQEVAPVPQPEQPTKMTVDEAVSKFAKTGVKADEPPVEGKVFRVMSKDEWNHVSQGGENYSGGFWSSDPSEYTGLLSEGDVLAAAPTQGPVQYRGLPKKDLIEAGRQHYNNLERRDITQISDAYRYENGKLVKIKGEPAPVPSAPESTTASSKPKESVPTETTTAQPLPKTEGGVATTVGEPPAAPPPVPAEYATDSPVLSRLANRHTEERMAAGELGQVAPNKGYTKTELVKAGEKMTPEEVNQHVSDLMQKTGDPIKQAAAVSAEEARLSKRSADLSRIAESNPNDVEAKIAADNAFKDLTDFHTGPVARLKEVFHGTGVGLQGEVPVDLSTYNGLREAYFKDTGKLPPTSAEPELRRTAARVSKAIEEDNGARTALSNEIEKQTASRKLPSYDEVRNNIRERMGLEPCKN